MGEPQAPKAERRRDYLLVFFSAVSCATILAACACGLAFALALADGSAASSARRPPSPPLLAPLPLRDRLLVLSLQACRLAGVGAAAFAILLELEWHRLLQLCAVMEFWAVKGLFHLWLSAYTFALVAPDGASDLGRSTALYRSLAAAALAGVGGFYLLAGALCVGQLRRARLRREEDRARAVEEMAEIEARRLQLRGLLACDE